jgi:glycosyltransferase involved in cell wall biosynthesis
MSKPKPKKPEIMSDEKPLVSIITPFFNRENFLAEAVESVINQTYPNWELFLIDDGSTDSGRQIAQNYVDKFPDQIYLLQHPDGQNKGASPARRLGFQKAKGEFVTFLDSDDVYFPDTLEKELNCFAQNPEAEAVCGNIECWFSWSKEASYFEKDFVIDLLLELNKFYQPPELLIHNLKVRGRKPGVDCVMLRTDFARKIQIFSETYKFSWEDQIFWSKVSLNGKIFIMNDCLAKYRQHPSSTCNQSVQTGNDIQSTKIFIEWLKKYLHRQKVENKEVWGSLKDYEKSFVRQSKLKKLKQIYRKTLPLSARYFLREIFVKAGSLFKK